MTRHCQTDLPVSLPYSVYFTDGIRQIETEVAQKLGISCYQLMERAGYAAFNAARSHYPLARHWLILCGRGNNGGDGYVVARLARQQNINVVLMSVETEKALPQEAQQAREAWLAAGGEILLAQPNLPKQSELIIDALLGIGLRDAPKEHYATLIAAANAHSAPIVSLDIPSGLNADTGYNAGEVINAQHTETFIAYKPGLLMGQARNWVGQLQCHPLGLGDELDSSVAPIVRLDHHWLHRWLFPRRPCSHKGDHGRMVVIGGDQGMGGAIRLAGEAALRSGAGLVRVLTVKQHVAPLLASCPELMVTTLSPSALEDAQDWADIWVIGPGLGQREWGRKALEFVRQSNKVMLWDADALNLLAQSPDFNSSRVLTPHMGEAARLLDCPRLEVIRDPFMAVKRLQQKYGGVVVLKGAGTLIAGQQQVVIADVGGPGMGTGGMGDLLSGVIGGLLAQKLSLYSAACAGTIVHGTAADNVAALYGERGMMASDVLSMIQYYVNPLGRELRKRL